MKIVFFIGALSGGGAERVVCNLSSWLAGRGHDVEILTMSDVEATYPISEKVKRQSLISTTQNPQIFLIAPKWPDIGGGLCKRCRKVLNF